MDSRYYLESIKLFGELVPIPTTQFNQVLQQAGDYLVQGNQNKALEEYFKALALLKKLDYTSIVTIQFKNEMKARIYYECSGIYISQGKIDQALHKLTKAIKLTQTDTIKIKIYLNLGNAYSNSYQNESAIANYTKALTFNPTDVIKSQIYANLGHAYYFSYKLDEAITCFTKALTFNPTDIIKSQIYANLGHAYYYSYKFDEAITSFNEAEALQFILNDQMKAWVYQNRGDAYYYLSDIDKAKIDFTHVVDLCENNPNLIDGQLYQYARYALQYKCSYQTTAINALDKNDILETIKQSKLIHPNRPNAFPKPAFIYCATKPGFAPIYFVFTQHNLIGADIADRFMPGLKHVISQAQVVQTEIVNITDPSMCTTLLNNKNLLEVNPSRDLIFHLDTMIAVEAKNQNKILVPLENKNIRETCLLSYHPNVGNEIIQKLKKDENFLSDSENYLTHVFFKGFIPESVMDRDCFWVPDRILPFSAQGLTSLVTCGATHSFLISYFLTCAGYQFNPLMEKAPPPSMEIVRGLYYGNSPLKFKFFDKKSAIVKKTSTDENNQEKSMSKSRDNN